MKACKKCGETKQKQDFSTDASKKDGKRSVCKACSVIAIAKWRAANLDKIRTKNAKWYAENKKKCRERQAKWYSTNKDKCLDRQAKWRADNPEKCLEKSTKYKAANREKLFEYRAKWLADNPEYKSKWYYANREACRIYSHTRRARKKEAGGKLSPDLADRLLKIQRGKCACGCKQPLGDDYHIDHIMPLALGGSNTDNNIQLLRAACNRHKSAKHPIDFMQSKGYLL